MPNDVTIKGPVGLRWRRQQVTNLQQDQAAIVGLLWRISISQGGMRGSNVAPCLTGPNGQCSPYLAEAIWDFQSFWKKEGLFRNIDGVVDPGMNTLRKMNSLARGQLYGPDPNDLPYAPDSPETPGLAPLPLPRTPSALSVLGLQVTHWKIASGGESYSGAWGPGGAVTARIVLSKDGDPQPHHFIFGGVSTGIGPLPFGVNIAPASLWSAGTRLVARDPSLSKSDFKGPCSILSGSSNFFAGIPDGGSVAIIVFGVRLTTSSLLIGGLLRNARALAATVGHFKGADIGLSLAVGQLT